MRALVAAAVLAATLNAAGPAWSVARSPNFEVYATGSPDRAPKALMMFEEAHAFFSSYLSIPPTARQPVRVLVFSGDKEYAPYRVNAGAKAFFQPSRERDYIVMKDFGGDAFQVVLHEYAHAALGLKGADLPPWLAEGLAEFFSSMRLDGKKATLGAVPDGRLNALRRGNYMSLAEVLAVERDSPEYNDRDHAGLFYAQSWALAHMLFADKRYRDRSSNLVSLFQAGPASAEKLAAVYDKTAEEMDKDFRGYLRRDAFTYFSVDFARTKRDAVAPTAVAPFDASLVVTDMLSSQIGKDAETRAALDALAAERPADLTLMELRGFFELRTGGAAAAEPVLKRAVDAGSKNPLVLAQYALCIGDRDIARATELLTAALAAAPDNAEIRIHTAAMLLRSERRAEAKAVLARVTRVPSNLAAAYKQMIAILRTPSQGH